jgi:hypothetical protein
MDPEKSGGSQCVWSLILIIFTKLKSKMDLQSRKLSFIQEFLRVQNEDIIRSLEKLLRKRKTELFEKNLKPMSLGKFNAEIDQALDDYNNDKVLTAMDLKARIQEWN